MASFIKMQCDCCSLTKERVSEIRAQVPTVQEDGRNFFQIDDMLFPEETVELAFAGNIWTNSRVFYEFDANVTQANRTNFLEAAAEWSDVTSIVFIERTNQPNFIHVQDATENSSAVGMIGGMQRLRVTSWNSRFIIAHEIAHALGAVHEQSRSDRDTFVRINRDNIMPGLEHNFDILDTLNFTRYDFASILHYPPNAFSRNQLPTIEAQPAYQNQQQFMGNRTYLTSRDAASMNTLYGRA